jgi:hypothetical protein
MSSNDSRSGTSEPPKGQGTHPRLVPYLLLRLALIASRLFLFLVRGALPPFAAGGGDVKKAGRLDSALRQTARMASCQKREQAIEPNLPAIALRMRFWEKTCRVWVRHIVAGETLWQPLCEHYLQIV